jgi:glyoxylase-like metal-dependent hydrolase (beta-lactamase superfamily II)
MSLARGPAAVRLAQNAWRIPTAPFSGTNSFAFVDDDGQVTLVDAGMSFAPPRIVAGLAAFGKHPKDVTRIVLTHAHADHAGGAARVADETGAPVAVHADDAAYARQGKIPPTDLATTTGRLLARFGAKRFTPFEVARELKDGDELDVAGGLRVVHTPGHTPGHVSLLHPASGVLVTGDCIMNVLGVRWSPRPLCTNPRLNQATADRLADLEYRVAAFTHGPHIADRARERVRGFLTTARRV